MLPFLGEYLYVNNQKILIIPSRDIEDQRILESDWTRAFWPIICEAEFPRYWVCTGKERIVRFFILP